MEMKEHFDLPSKIKMVENMGNLDKQKKIK